MRTRSALRSIEISHGCASYKERRDFGDGLTVHERPGSRPSRQHGLDLRHVKHLATILPSRTGREVIQSRYKVFHAAIL